MCVYNFQAMSGAGEEEDFGEGDFVLDDDEGEWQGEEDEEELSPDNPLFAQLQEKLQKQLNDMWDTVDVAIRDKQAERLQLTTERENIGVELYSLQQTLGKLQQRLTDANEEKVAAEQERIQVEEELKEAKQALEDNQQDLKTRTREYESNRNALDQLNDVVLRLEKHNQEIKNQVAVTRRETYKSEQAASEAEVSKLEQDEYIDRLTHQVQNITVGLATIEAQILAQRGETKTARDALLQASLEMEKINFERNHLLQEWNSSLISVKRRSETLSEIEKAAAKQEEEIGALQNENSGLKTQIQQQHDLAERNQALLSKINARVKQLEVKIEEASKHRKNLQTQLAQLTSLAQEREQDVSKLLIERNQATTLFNQSTKGTNEVSNQIHEIEDAILRHCTEQSDLKRDAVAAQNAVQKVREQIAGKDRELGDLQNEVVRLKIDKLNITGQSEKLEKGLREIVAELQQKDNLISQYEMQIRKNNVDIEKKQSEVDKLNRLYDGLKKEQNGEEYGPLERQIRILQSKIEQTDQTAQQHQSQWLKKQTELVGLENSCEKIEETNAKATAHIAVLSRKRDRTRNQLEATEKEIERYQIHIRLLQREMSRLGLKLSEHSDAGNLLVEGNINLEAEILEGLQKKEEEAAASERKIEEIAHQREQLADDLMETEKNIMLCEKKLQLAKEMRDALDPNFGAKELSVMRKEIARMELRLKQIRKQQGVILQEMEYALKRRETIATRGAIQKRLNKDRTRADIVRGITEMKRDVKKINKEAAQQDNIVHQHLAAQQQLQSDLETITQIQREVQFHRDELERNLQEEEKNKTVSQAKLERLHAKSRLLQSATGRARTKSAESYQQTIENLKNQQVQVKDLITVLEDDFPHLKNSLDTVRERMIQV